MTPRFSDRGVFVFAIPEKALHMQISKMNLRLGGFGSGGGGGGGGGETSERYWRVYMGFTRGAVADFQLSEMMFYDRSDNRLDGSGTPSASNENNGAVTNLFDGSDSTYWGSNVVSNQWVQYDFGSEVSVGRVDLRAGNITSRAPGEVAVFSSPDETTWTMEFVQPVLTNWGLTELRSFIDDRAANDAYRYFRLHCTANSGPYINKVAEIEMRESEGGSDITSGWTVTANQTPLGGTLASETIDDNNATAWISGLSDPNHWLDFDAGVGNTHTVAEMLMRVSDDNTRKTMRHKLQGSNDGTNFSDIAYFGVADPSELTINTSYVYTLNTV